jgi:hypothetical protein
VHLDDVLADRADPVVARDDDTQGVEQGERLDGAVVRVQHAAGRGSEGGLHRAQLGLVEPPGWRLERLAQLLGVRDVAGELEHPVPVERDGAS